MILGLVAMTLAAMPFVLTLVNLFQLRTPEPAAGNPAISVLIPARNEEANIAEAVKAILESENVKVDLVVLDDGSTDRTAAILGGIDDPRLRVVVGRLLPAGWTGKQHACMQLAQSARCEIMVFVDADVRLAPDALSRMAGFMLSRDIGLASGFPRQLVRTWSEQLLLPLIHFMLMGFLPIFQMRRSLRVGLGAACGQLIVVRRSAYDRAGGHAADRGSLHDGLALPRAFRRAGILTDLFDATAFSTCRMYANAAQVWQGLGKNAVEGMARPIPLVLWTIILAGGQIMPALLMISAPSIPAFIGLILSIGLRLMLARRFHQPALSALFPSVGVAALLVVQWAALLRNLVGQPARWRGREYPAS